MNFGDLWAASSAFDHVDGPEPAMWLPVSGLRFGPVRVIRRRPERAMPFGEALAAVATTVFTVRQSEVETPEKGDVVEMGGEVATGGPGTERFTIQSSPMKLDPNAVIWTCDTVRTKDR